ncbi:hypothetical protein PINS_up015190 [Pythium insidiosum]|nr:hypothetical protein PINS_up015190 [Pythium insidiosum]
MSSSSKKNVLIHVFDEYRKTAKDFVCPRDLLLERMKYFRAYLNQSNEHDEIDISVHCDVEIFEWLVDYIQQQRDSEWRPRLTLDNIASILVSSEFLQMDTLVDECIAYIVQHMPEFLQLRVDFACLSESTVAKIARLCSAQDLRQLHDPKDKILSKLQRHKVENLIEEFEAEAGGLQWCANCEMLFLKVHDHRLHCSKGICRVAVHGELIARHCAKAGWSATEWVKSLVQDRGISWSAAYWYIWASCTYISCEACHRFCPLTQFQECAFHPGPITAGSGDSKFSCCGSRIFFGGEFDGAGCKFKPHVASGGAPADTRQNIELLKSVWDQILGCSAAVKAPALPRSLPPVDTSVLFPTTAGDVPPELVEVGKKPWPPTYESSTPRRRRQWQIMRLQEHDRVRIHLITRQLVEMRSTTSTS